MADLTPRIERLVGRLAGGRGGGAARPAGGAAPTLRSGDPGFAEAGFRFGAMPLDQFAREGVPLEIQVPWLDATLWFVSGEGDAELLVRDGVSPGRIWTAGELIKLIGTTRLADKIVRIVALAKVVIDGEVVEIKRRQASET